MPFWTKGRDYDRMPEHSVETRDSIKDAVKDTKPYRDNYTGETIER
ncbi:MAG: hypothetical protein HG467_002480 [Clostridiales bacterium]|nr:hypothetical protein [Clostridiales bacterium]